VPTTEPERPSTGSKVAGAAKRFAIPLYLAMVGAVTWLFLWTSAMTVGPFGKLSYPDTIARIVTISLIVSLVPAIILLVLKRGKRYSYTLIRVVAMIVSVLFCLLFLAGIIRWAGSMGVGNTTFAESLMGMAGIPGVLAIVCLGLFAYFLARYKEDDGSLDANKQELTDVDDKIRKANDDNTDAESDLRAVQARHDAVKENIQRLNDDMVELGNKLTEARKANSESKASKDLKDEEAKLSRKQSYFNGLPDEIKALEAQIKAEKDLDYRKHLEDTLADKRQELKDLPRDLDDTYPKSQAFKVAQLRKDVENSPEYQHLAAVEKEHAEKSEEREEARKSEMDLRGEVRSAQTAVAKTAARVETHTKRRDELNQSLDTADKADRSVWRDLVFPLAVTFILAVAFFPTWQGYVMTALL
jgi:septal ring factor EnvC (AmiA/AmiB activator)